MTQFDLAETSTGESSVEATAADAMIQVGFIILPWCVYFCRSDLFVCWCIC